MKNFTAWQYLMIDVANQFGLDKKLFEERIEWAQTNIDKLEELADQAETKPLYHKAVMAIRKVQQGLPTGHMVGLDASCSGIQIMSAMTGCWAGAEATNLVNPDARNDAYSMCTENMNQALEAQFLSVQVPRGKAKQALMTSFYGSKAKPIEIFGEDTPELVAFYEAAIKLSPGAWELLQDLKAAWQSYSLVHEWDLPDGYHARIKVMERQEARVEVDELDHASFTYIYYVNQGQKKGISLPANVTHSVDAFVLREMHRRCNYDPLVLFFAQEAIYQELDLREQHLTCEIPVDEECSIKLKYYIELFEATKQPTAAILPFIQDGKDTQYLSNEHLMKLQRLVKSMDQHKPFPLVTIHDDFKASPVNCDWVRHHYAYILAELSESMILDSIFTQIYGMEVKYQKLSDNLGEAIRNCNYALS
jgi:hypothetical protein